MTHIPYAGAGPAVIALLGGHVDAVSSGPASVVQQIRAGRLRALAHWGDAPLTTLPGVPSLKERGFNVQFAQWSALFAPASTPDPDRRTIACDSAQADVGPSLAADDPECRQPDRVLDAPQFAIYWKSDAQAMTAAVKRIGKLE